MFGSGRFDIRELLSYGSIDGGTLTAVLEKKPSTRVEVPVRIKLLGYSGRVASPSLSEGGTTLRFIGMGMKSVDVAGEITREETEREQNRKEGSRRDKFLRLLKQSLEHKTQDKSQ